MADAPDPSAVPGPTGVPGPKGVPGPIDRPDQAAVTAVRFALRTAGYTVEGLADAVGADAFAALADGDDMPARVALRRRGGDPLAILARVFLLGDEVSRPAAERALPVAAAGSLGLIEVAGERVRARLDLRPYGEPDTDWWVVSDRTDGGPGPGPGPGRGLAAPGSAAATTRPPLAEDHVLGVGGASLTLARITPRPRVARALDVGTGCGVQALHLSRHADEITVTDLNPRALRCAALTAGLSGVDWQGRQGSLLDPVAGQAYDLVVANPPFVVSPGARFTYRDAGLPADDLGRRLLAGIPDHLAAGGWCVTLLNWLHVAGQDWWERVAAWLPQTGIDAWVVQRDVQDPASYARTWLRDAGEHRGPDYAERYESWVQGLTAMGAEGIGFGWVVLHRSGRSAPWLSVEDLSAAPTLPRGDQVLDWFAGQDAVADAGAVGLLATALRPAADLRVTRTSIGSARLPVQVDRAGGWRPAIALDEAVMAVVDRCDGRLPLGRAVDAVADRLGVEPVDLLAAGLPALRALVAAGALDVVAPSPDAVPYDGT